LVGSEPKQNEVTRLPLVREHSLNAEGLVAVLRRLSTAHSIEEIVQVVTQAARALLGADGVTFVLREGDLCYYLEEDAISPLWKGKRFPMTACISGWCMLEGKAAAIPDIYQDQRIPQDAYRPTFVRSLAMVPVGQEKPMAAIGAYWATSREITGRELELLQTVANAATLGIGYVQLQEREKELAKAAAPPLEGRTVRDPDILSLKSARPGLLEKAIRLAHVELPRNSLAAYGFAALCVVIATLVRFGIGALVGAQLTPFGTYYPAVLVATLIGGISSGLLALLLAAITASWAFLPVPYSFEFVESSQAVSLVIFCVANALIIGVAAGYRRAYRRLDEEQNKRQLLVRELQHRSRNASAVIQAVISQSLKGDPEAARKISGRIRALVAADELITQSDLQALNIRDLLLAELKPFGKERVLLQGGVLRLDATHAKALALTFHELATNAAKYGALSDPGGLVVITWTVSDGSAKITWEEMAGPRVTRPTRRGFGTSLIERLLKSVGGKMEREFRTEGVRCLLSFPSSHP
jgi:two-component sensor histidine kinase